MSELTETTVSFAVPGELRAGKRFCVWKYEVRGGKPTKVPYDARTGRRAASDNPDTWCSYDEALEALKTGKYDGIGFFFSEDDPYGGVDLDGCRDPETGKIHPEAQAVIDGLGTYTEVSPSGTGVKIFLEGSKPGERCRTRKTPWHENIEIYDKDRFFTLTGQHLHCTPLTVNARHEQFAGLYNEFFPTREEGERTPRPETVVIPDDEELLKRARAVGGGSGVEFSNLYDKGLVPEGKSHSDADWRLMGKLAYWTGGDAERMIRLFERCALYRPPSVSKKGEMYVRNSVINLLAKYAGDYYDPEGQARKARKAIETRLVPRRKAEPWRGLAGQIDRAVYDALLYAGSDGYGTARERGVEVKVASRELAERAGISKSSALRSAKRLEERELIERIPHEKGKRRGSILVLFAPEEAEKHFVHNEVLPRAETIDIHGGISTEETITEEGNNSLLYGINSRQYFAPNEVNLLRLRYGTADDAYLRRLGKGVVPLLEALLGDPNRSYPLWELVQVVKRRKDNVRNSLRKLAHAGLVEEVGHDLYRICPNFEANFERELEETGIVESERLQREKHAREREAWNTLPEAPAAEPPPPA